MINSIIYVDNYATEKGARKHAFVSSYTNYLKLILLGKMDG